MVYEIVWQGGKRLVDNFPVTPVYRQAFEWTTEPPTKDGWYWAYCKPGNDIVEDAPEIVTVTFAGELGIIVESAGHDDWSDTFEVFTHWLGPIPEPEKPSTDF